MAEIEYFRAPVEESTIVSALTDWVTNLDDGIIGELREPNSTLKVDFNIKFAGPFETVQLSFEFFRNEDSLAVKLPNGASEILGSITANTAGAILGGIAGGFALVAAGLFVGAGAATAIGIAVGLAVGSTVATIVSEVIWDNFVSDAVTDVGEFLLDTLDDVFYCPSSGILGQMAT